MSTARAKLSFNRQSAKKVRLVADVIRGLRVPVALSRLQLMPQQAAKTMTKLLSSAVANARQSSPTTKPTPDNLFIKEIRIDEGPTYKRYRPRAHGRATLIRKRTSHISLVLAEKTKS